MGIFSIYLFLFLFFCWKRVPKIPVFARIQDQVKSISIGNGFYCNRIFSRRQDQVHLLKEWMDKGMTPDRKPLKQMNLILPTREDAVAIKPIADRYRFHLVLYPGEDGNFWNPFPAEE